MIDSFKGDYAFLSNFYPSTVELDGLAFPTVEHAYQAAKTLDGGVRFGFTTGTPGQAKYAGKRVKLRPDWEEVKVNLMGSLLAQKFAPGTELYYRLLATQPHELVEGNHWNDTFWGVCRGKGQNWLGKLLMKIRDKEEV